jgi:hypothetical protein
MLLTVLVLLSVVRPTFGPVSLWVATVGAC